MPVDNLLKALHDFLNIDGKATAATADPLRRDAIQEDRVVRRMVLMDELEAFERVRRQHHPIRQILVAVDDSLQAQWATDYAAGLAHELGARVSLVHVVQISNAETIYNFDLIRSQLLVAGEECLKRRAADVPDCDVERILREGAAADGIVASAVATRADLIVMGAHGRGRVGQLFIGSTALAVMRQAECPVLTVRHEPTRRALETTQEATAQHQVSMA